MFNATDTTTKYNSDDEPNVTWIGYFVFKSQWHKQRDATTLPFQKQQLLDIGDNSVLNNKINASKILKPQL